MSRKIGLVEVFIKEPKYNKDFLAELWNGTKSLYKIGETYSGFEILEPFEIENPVNCKEFRTKCPKPSRCPQEGIVSSYGYYKYFVKENEPVSEDHIHLYEDMFRWKNREELEGVRRETETKFGPQIISLAKMRKDNDMDVLVTVNKGVVYFDILARCNYSKEELQKRLTQPKTFPDVPIPALDIIHCKFGHRFEPIDSVLYKNRILIVGELERDENNLIGLTEKIRDMRKIKKPDYVIKYKSEI